VRDYFWPDGLWAGYARFFQPCIPSRIGSVLLKYIKQAIKDSESRDMAIEILSNCHPKNVHSDFGEVAGTVLCVPTPEAQIAIDVLRHVEYERR
jgi:hypothetical protein